MVVPFLPFFIRELGVKGDSELATWSGLVYSGPFLTSFLATPFWGSVGDRHGQKLMVVRAIFGLGIAQIFIGLSQNVYQLLLFRILQGVISGFIASALALVSTSTPKERMGYALGLLQSATAGGVMLGPAVGGFLADVMGYRQIFLVTAAICFVCGGVIIKMVVETPDEATGESKPSVMQNFTLMLTDKRLRLIAVAIVLSQGAALMIEPIFALFIERFISDTRYIATLTGLTISIAGVFMVISAPWWGKRNDQMGFKQNLIYSLSGTGIAYALHIFVPNLAMLTVLRAALGFARGGTLHALFSMTSLRSPPERRSGMIGIASSFSVLGNLIGPLSGGIIAGNFGITAVLAVNSAVFLVTGAMIWKYYSESRGLETPPTG